MTFWKQCLLSKLHRVLLGVEEMLETASRQDGAMILVCSALCTGSECLRHKIWGLAVTFWLLRGAAKQSQMLARLGISSTLASNHLLALI